MLARLSDVTPVALPITGAPQAEMSFTVPGAFSFALPRNFVNADPEIQAAWQMGSSTPILVAAQDSPASPDMFFAVYDGADIAPEFRTYSVWLLAVLADEFRRRSQAAGTPAIMGPTPILVAGERGIWFVLNQMEGGYETHKWTVETFHNGRGYVAIMHVRNGADGRYTDAFWSAVGSWTWADSSSPVASSPLPPPLPPPWP